MTVSDRPSETKASKGSEAVIRPLGEADLDVADHVMRQAFGTYLGAPDPQQVFGDSDHVHTRYRANPDAAFCAELDGEVVGSNLATRWGSFGFFGPLTVRPDLWDEGIGGKLMEPVMELFDRWGVRHAGLFTFPESAKHVGLYQKHGFWPQELTPLLAGPPASAGEPAHSIYSEADENERESVLTGCREVADAVYSGLDLSDEIAATATHGYGDTVLVEGPDGLDGFAVCHCGPGTEAGSDTCFIKFGAARPGPGAEERFAALVDSCEAVARSRDLGRMVAGGNTSRQGAYRALLDRGYRPFLNGLQMLRPAEPAYNRPDAWVIDDLR